MIVALPMYDLPWLQDATDRFWRAVAKRLRCLGVAEVPEALTRTPDLYDLWASPRLLLAQTCGYPLVSELRETVQLVATPRYRAQGCEGATHRAAIVVRNDAPVDGIEDLRGRRVGVNDSRSNTGMNLLRAAVAPHAKAGKFFGDVRITGSHARSFAALVRGCIDVASIDAVTLAHLRARYPDHARHVRVLDWTAPSPSLPLVTASATSAQSIAVLQLALRDVAMDQSLLAVRQALLIDGFETGTLDGYADLLTYESDAADSGYPALR